jgi:hypothetical protein
MLFPHAISVARVSEGIHGDSVGTWHFGIRLYPIEGLVKSLRGGCMSNPTLTDIQAELKRVGAEARAAYEAAWDARMAEWEQGIHRIDIGQDG